jgi:hypothetical protein
LKKSSKGVPLKKSSPKPSVDGPVTVLSDRIETTEGWTFLATSTNALPKSLAVATAREDVSVDAQPQTGIIMTKVDMDKKTQNLLDHLSIFIPVTSLANRLYSK